MIRARAILLHLRLVGNEYEKWWSLSSQPQVNKQFKISELWAVRNKPVTRDDVKVWRKGSSTGEKLVSPWTLGNINIVKKNFCTAYLFYCLGNGFKGCLEHQRPCLFFLQWFLLQAILFFHSGNIVEICEGILIIINIEGCQWQVAGKGLEWYKSHHAKNCSTRGRIAIVTWLSRRTF